MTYFLGRVSLTGLGCWVAWVYALSLFTCAQAALLGLQSSFGPAFFLPQRVRGPWFIFSLRLTLFCPPTNAACGFAGIRLSPAAPRYRSRPAGRLRDLHGRDRASARGHVRQAEAARRTDARIVQSGALRTSIRMFSPLPLVSLLIFIRASIRSVSSG